MRRIVIAPSPASANARAHLLRGVSLIALAAGGAVAVQPARAGDTPTSLTSATGTWSDPTAWSNGAPGATSATTVNNGGTATVDGGDSTDTLAIGPVTGSNVAVSDGDALTVGTSIANQNVLSVNGSYYGAELRVAGGATVTLAGGGAVTLSNFANNYIRDAALGTGTLINVDNTISGAGQFGNGQLAIVNQAKGLIDANVSNTLILDSDSGGITNAGTLRASAGGTLSINNSTVTNTGGLILARDAGSTVTLSNSGVTGGTLTTTSGGVLKSAGTVTLNGVSLSAGSTYTGVDGTSTYLRGTFTNNGNVAVNGSYYGAELRVTGGTTTTLTGGGAITLSNFANNYIRDADLGTGTLVNVDNTIAGAGYVGNGQLTIDNRAAGVINANVSTALTLTGNAGGITNAGLLEATGAGTLAITNTTVTQSGGGNILSSGAGAKVVISNSTINGTLGSTGGGAIDSGSTNHFNTVTLTTGSTYTNLDNTVTYLNGTMTNKGVLSLAGSYFGSEFRVGGGTTTTLTGGGAITLSNFGGNYIRDADLGTGKLINVDNTISGAGQFGNAQLAIDNQAGGVINANLATPLVLQGNAAGITNEGLIEATAGGTLNINATTITQSGAGRIVSSGAGSTVTLSSSTINNGPLTATAGGALTATGQSTLNNVTVTAGTKLSTLDNATTYLAGTITNNGTLAAAGSYYGTEYRVTGGTTVTLNGGGTFALSNFGGNIVRDADKATGTLVNVDNTITGAGVLGSGQLHLDNQVGGTVNANFTGSTLILQGNTFDALHPATTAVTNAGLLEATNGATLDVRGTITNAASGVLQSSGLTSGTASKVTIDSATITGGTLTTAAGSTMIAQGTSTLSNLSVSAGTTVSTVDNATTYLGGTIANKGTIALNGSYFGSELRIVGGSTVTLTGGGTVALSDFGGNYFRDADAATGTLNNVDNTISGAGHFGNGQLHIVNNDAGAIVANGANALNLNTNAAGLTNNGTLRATNGATLNVQGGPLSNFTAGTLLGSLTSASSAVYQADAGSTLNLNTGAIVTTAANITLNGAGSAITTTAGTIESSLTTIASAGTLQVLGGRNYTTANDIGNVGLLRLGGGTFTANSLTNANVGAVSGFGTITPSGGMQVANAGLITATGGTLALSTGVSGAGRLISSAGASLDLSAAASGSSAGVLQLNGGLALGTHDITVSSDYFNSNFGVGNAFDNHANVTGTGKILASGNAALAITGAGVSKGTTASPTLNLGQFHTGGASSASFAIQNTGTTGPSIRGALQTTGPLTGLSGTGVTPANFGPIALGASTSPYSISVAAGSAGVVSGSVKIVSNFDNITGPTLGITGTAYNLAQATIGNTQPVSLGNFRVGAAPTASLGITNSAASGAFTENLDAAAGATTGSATIAGSVTALAAGAPASSGILVGLAPTAAGAASGTATVKFTSNAAGVDTLGNTALAAQTVSLTGNAFRLATGSAATPVAAANVHVGGASSVSLAVTNTAAADGFSEKLNAVGGTVTGNVTGTSGAVSLLAAGASSGAITAALDTSTAGAKSGTVAVTFASDGTGTTGHAASANGSGSVTVTGNVYNLASSSTIGAVNFGVLHTGTGPQTRALSVTNTAPTGAFSEGLNSSFGTYTNTGTVGVTAFGAVTNLAAGATDSSSLQLAVGTTAAGTVSGSILVHQASNGTISGLANTALADQNVGVSGTVQASGTITNLAVGQVNTNPVAFGAVRQGTVLSQALSITNAAPLSAFSESLIAAPTTATGGASVTGGIGGATAVPSLAAGATDTSHVVVGLSTATAGVNSGTATVDFKSDGTAFTGGTVTDLGTQNVGVTATVYRVAAPTLNTTSATLAARVGGTASTALSVTNTSPDTYTEALKASVSAAPANFTSSGAITGLAAAATDAGSLKIGLSTTTAGTFTGTQAVAFTSTGAGTDGATDLALSGGSVALTGKVYQTATAGTVAPVNFGIVHVGDTVAPHAVTVANTASGALTDTLRGGFGAVSGPFTAAGTLADVAAGASSPALTVSLNTATAGVFTGSAALALTSHDADLADVAVAAGPVGLSGTVNNFAVSGFGKTGGAGVLSGSGTGYTLDFGSVAAGTNVTATLDAANLATGPADALAGGFSITSGSGFGLSGFNAFAGLLAGGTDGGLSVSFDPTVVGGFREVIDLSGTGSNASGYSGAVTDTTLTIEGTLLASGDGGGGPTPTPEPGALTLLATALGSLAGLRRRT